MPGLNGASADPLFAPLPAYDRGWLRVSALHQIAYYQRANPGGIPTLLIHGGPGSASSAAQARFFDPQHYRLIQYDQRACGESLAAGEIEENQTAALLADIEALRQHLQIERWIVVGGSWGGCLATLYAAAYPQYVRALLLRGVFLCRKQDLRWFFEHAGLFYPEAWRPFAQLLEGRNAEQRIAYLAQVFSQGSGEERLALSQAWFCWEQALNGHACSQPDEAMTQQLLRRYRIQSHFLLHRCWLDENALVDCCRRLPSSLPVTLVQGLRDAVCRPDGARRLQRAAPQMRLIEVAAAGHELFHPAMVAAMLSVARQYEAL